MVLIVDDLVGLATQPVSRVEDRRSQYGEAAARLKGLALELGIATLITVSLSRFVDVREERRPRLTDLPDDGTLADVADVVLGVYRDDAYNPHSEKPGVVELMLLKNREAPLPGRAELYLHGGYGVFFDLNVPERD